MRLWLAKLICPPDHHLIEIGNETPVTNYRWIEGTLDVLDAINERMKRKAAEGTLPIMTEHDTYALGMAIAALEICKEQMSADETRSSTA